MFISNVRVTAYLSERAGMAALITFPCGTKLQLKGQNAGSVQDGDFRLGGEVLEAVSVPESRSIRGLSDHGLSLPSMNAAGIMGGEELASVTV